MYSLWRPNCERSVKSCHNETGAPSSINDSCIDSYPNIVWQIEQTEDLLIRGAVVERACVCVLIFHHFMLVWWAGSIELVNWISHLQPWCYWEDFWHCLMNRCTDTLSFIGNRCGRNWKVNSKWLHLCRVLISVIKKHCQDNAVWHLPKTSPPVELYKTVRCEVCPFIWLISYLLNGFESIRTHALAKSFSLVVS